MEEPQTLEDWLAEHEAACESGQSQVSREQAIRLYYQKYPKHDGHQNGEG